MNRADFVLAGLTSWSPLDDQPSVTGSYRWFVDDWTGQLPSCERFAQAWGVDVAPWPRGLTDQVELALADRTVVLVSGDPLVATPHQHLLKILQDQGVNCLVRRRPGVVDLVAERLGQRPRLLPASARTEIDAHLAQRHDPLLVVEDDQVEDLWSLGSAWQQAPWKITCYANLGSDNAWEGRLADAPAEGLHCLVFQGDLGVSPAP